MASYRVEISKTAEKILFRLPKNIIPKIVGALQALSYDPRPHGHRKLSGEENTYRIRIQNYRIIYEIHDDLILIKILKIGDRKDVYR